MEEECIGSQGAQWTVAHEKRSDTCAKQDMYGVPDIYSQCPKNKNDGKAL
jgi:hypothetical protein